MIRFPRGIRLPIAVFGDAIDLTWRPTFRNFRNLPTPVCSGAPYLPQRSMFQITSTSSALGESSEGWLLRDCGCVCGVTWPHMLKLSTADKCSSTQNVRLTGRFPRGNIANIRLNKYTPVIFNTGSSSRSDRPLVRLQARFPRGNLLCIWVGASGRLQRMCPNALGCHHFLFSGGFPRGNIVDFGVTSASRSHSIRVRPRVRAAHSFGSEVSFHVETHPHFSALTVQGFLLAQPNVLAISQDNDKHLTLNAFTQNQFGPCHGDSIATARSG